MTINGRLAVIFSAEDLTVGMVGHPVDGIVGYSPMQVKGREGSVRFGASEIMANILSYASGGVPVATTGGNAVVAPAAQKTPAPAAVRASAAAAAKVPNKKR